MFAGGFSLESAEDICSGAGLPVEDILDTLGRLVDRSLVQREDHSAQARYRLLETVRQYALERLAERAHDQGDTVRAGALKSVVPGVGHTSGDSGSRSVCAGTRHSSDRTTGVQRVDAAGSQPTRCSAWVPTRS